MGTGMACTPSTSLTVAAKLTLQSTWPSALAVAQGMGPVNIWLLSTYNVDSSNKITGTTKTCGNQTPPITLNDTGDMAVGAAPGSMAQVQIVIPKMTWEDPHMPVTNITGTLGGWNVGSSINIDPSTTCDGLASSSMYCNPTVTWPQQGMQIPTTDIIDSDNDMHPGITGVPKGDGGFYLPHVGVTPDTAQADQLYLVLRTEVQLSGTMMSCSEQTGNATVNLLNNHVIGCRRVDTGGDCMAADWQFIDSNTTIYMVMSGTFDAKVLSTDGGAATCDDVLAQTYSN